MRDMTASGLKAWLVARVAAISGSDPHQIDARQRFGRHGIDSLHATRLIAELSTRLERSLSPTLIWEYPTIEALAAHLGGETQRIEEASVGAGEIGAATYGAGEPIAIVGMACRFPGAPDEASFWDLLRDGVDAVGVVPSDRGWDEALVAAGVDRAERDKVRRGAFLDRVDAFDPFFFGISPREAMSMDPQQRLMLELCWEALERAGIPPRLLAGSPAGVFAGAIWSDYEALMYRGAAGALDQYAVTGAHHSIIANRISYLLGLQGPSLSVDTACSSGLVVVHLACESLRRGECNVALAGAVNLNLLPESAVAMARFGALSPDGRCYTFDGRANGYVRGEGAGVVVLKPLSRALADGDPIRAVIRAAAVNNDGASNGLTAPNPAAQKDMLRAAYQRAGVLPAHVQFVEAHGTGTPLGDPIEGRALGEILGAGRVPETPLLIGSVKTNVGHLEAAAGIIGLIKVVLAIEHRVVPPNLHFASANPDLPLAALGLDVPTTARPWPVPERALLAGVSSFGMGGTNSHAVVEEWPGPPVEVLPLAAESPQALRARVTELLHTLSLDAGRTPVRERCAEAAIRHQAADSLHGRPGASFLAVTARSHGELERELIRFLESEAQPLHASRGVVFSFPGQGSQWHGMARDLLSTEPVFRAAIEACDRRIHQHLGWSLLDELTASREASRLDHIEVSFPAIVAVDIALAAWWRAAGLEPAAVVGHSTGEIAAAHVAGVLDLDDAMRIICMQGRLLGALGGQGQMALVGLSWEDTAEALVGFEGRVFRAIQDSVDATVVAGEPDAVTEVLSALSKRGILGFPVRTNVAPHSPLSDSLRETLALSLQAIRPRAARIPLFSEVTGAEVDGHTLDASHWVRNLCDPAFFSAAIDALIARGHRLFLDVGPHPTTRRSIESNLRRAGVEGMILPSQGRDLDARGELLGSLAALHTRGVRVCWDAVYPAGEEVVAPVDALWLLPLSARDPKALATLSAHHAALVRPGRSSLRMNDIAYTASVRREHHPHRLAAVGTSREEVGTALAALSRGELAQGATSGRMPASGPPRVVFVFPGQGSQWPGMGRALLAAGGVFRQALEACDEAIRREAGFSVLEVLAAPETSSRLDEIDVVQPVLFAVEVALAALWRSWGVEPVAVVGHSMGEVAAAHVAGILSLLDATRVICRRSKLLRKVSGHGAMGVVELTMAEAEAALLGHEGRLSVAVSNGPRSTVLSGDPDALEKVLATLEQRGVFCRRVKVDVASHSPQMDPLLDELRSMLGDLAPGEATLTMRSTVTGADVTGAALDGAYWASNLRAPVLFSRTIQELLTHGPTIFVEISPHPILVPALEEHLREQRGGSGESAAIASLRRGSDERRSMLEALGEVWVRGVDVDFRPLFPSGGRVVPLPAYPWQRERFWLDTQTPPVVHHGKVAASGQHPLLGAPFTSSRHPGEQFWQQNDVSRRVPWLSDHRIGDDEILPGSATLEMVLAAGASLYGSSGFEISELRLEKMLSLPCAILELSIVRSDAGAAVEIASRARAAVAWERYGRAELRQVRGEEQTSAGETLSRIQERCRRELDVAEHHARLERLGVIYGPRLQSVERLWLGDGVALGRVRLPSALPGDEETDGAAMFHGHPVLLDGALQVLMALVISQSPDRLLVPVMLSGVRLRRRLPEQIWVHACGNAQQATLTILDDEGLPLLEVRGLRFAPLGAAEDPLDACVHEVAWRRRDLPQFEQAPDARQLPGNATPGRDVIRLSSTPEPASWLVLGGPHGTGAALAMALRARGEPCVEVDGADPGKLAAHLPRACRGVIHCGGLEATSWAETTPATLEADLRRGPFAAVHLVQAILRRAFRDPPPLFLVTRGSRSAGPGGVSAVQGTLWGLGGVIALEHPELSCKRIDLPSIPWTGEVDSLLRELSAQDGEEQIALRPDGRFVARLVRGSLPGERAATPSMRDGEGTYLIVGGLGGLGLALARWMVDRGARSLALVGRSAPSEEARAELRALEASGAVLRVLQGDVALRTDVERIVSEIRGSMSPLRGVVHAAAVVADRTLLELGEAQLWATLRPKVLGAWNLHAATRDQPLDFFMLYSSVSSLLGVPGQAAYASSNAFLDAFAQARTAEGSSTTSLQWGLFSGVGVAAPDQRSQRLASQGLESFTTEEGLELFGRALAHPRAEIGLFRFSLRRWLESIPQAAGMRYLSELPREPSQPHEVETASMRDSLAKASPAERLAMLESHVSEQLGRVLRLAPTRIGRDVPFTNLGLDSLTSLETRNRLESSLGTKLQAALFFTYPEVSSLARHLLARLDLGMEEERVEQTTSSAQEEVARVDEPLAIVGMACRFPGGADGPDAYWRMLEQGVDAVVEIPSDRWPQEAIPGDRPETRRAALLDQVDGFDAAFFGISPREATSLDPQQRLLLEIAWEALEHARQPSERLTGSATGVFTGLNALDYQHRLIERGIQHVDAYSTTGNLLSTAAGRISYTLGFQGPCVAVDTACSSSLVAISLACQSLRSGDCDLALAGGVNLILSPYAMAALAGTQALSPDGRCKTLDARANGFVRGEGAGLLVLKRLSDARRDGDRIWALVRGWAVNQDGKSSGLTAPNVLSQQDMLRKALTHAGVSAHEIGYVEMHGTGTPLGDPIELDALREVVGRPRTDGATCVLGAVKTNIGHLEPAAGVAGVIKAVLSLEHGAIPGNLHFRQLNPRISLEGTPFVIPTATVGWPRQTRRRLAGVSSFGISGTNAHIVLEESPGGSEGSDVETSPATPAAVLPPGSTPRLDATELLVVSARSDAGLSAAAGRLYAHLQAHSEQGLDAVAFSLATTRSALPHRLAISASSRETLADALHAASLGETPAGGSRGRVEMGARPKVVFVFPGQGSQWAGMGRQLLAEEPVFREALQACDQAIRAEAGWSLLEALRADEGASLDRIDVVQPVLFAIEVALSALWQSWGVKPDCVVGHSMGEVAAAHVAGVLSLEDAVAVICRRSQLLRRLSGQGEMALVELSLEAAQEALVGYEDKLSAAVSNSPRATVLSGEPEALGQVVSRLEARGIFCRRVKVDVASHSPQVDPLTQDLMSGLGAISPQAARVPMRSTVTTTPVEGAELGASYWMANLRQPVRFAQTVTALLDGGYGLFVEMSPHPLLVTAIEEMRQAKGPPGSALASLRRERAERSALLESLGALWAQGQPVAWDRVLRGEGRRVSLPTYPWQRERYWIDGPIAQNADPRRHAGGHPLLGEALSVSTLSGLRVWETTLDLGRLPWLRDHRVQDLVVFPGAGYLEMALCAGRTLWGERPFAVTDVALVEALTLTDDETTPVQLVTTPQADGNVQMQVASRRGAGQDGDWTVHARGTLGLVAPAEAPARVDLGAVRARLRKVLSGEAIHALLSEMGLVYGPAFRGLLELRRGADEALGKVCLPEAAGTTTGYRLHPALLDACMQAMAGALDDPERRAWMPVALGALEVVQPPAGELWCHVRFAEAPRASRAPDESTPRSGPPTPRRKSADLSIVDASGALIARLSGLVVQQLARGARRQDPMAEWFLDLSWSEAPARAARPAPGRYLLLGHGGDLGLSLREALERAGHVVVHAVASAPGEVPRGTWPIDDTTPAGVRALLADAFGERPPTALVHLRALDEPPQRGATDDEPLDAKALGNALGMLYDSVLHTVQALTAMAYRDPPRLWLVTRGTQPVEVGLLSLDQAPLLGLGRVIAMEHPELRCTRLDLAAIHSAHDLQMLLTELLADDGEHEIAFRDARRLVARFLHAPPDLPSVAPQPSPTAPRAEASYLVTGGLGGLGLRVAKWLAERGAGHVVLVGRTGVTTAAQKAAVAEIEAIGARVTVAPADVAQRADVERILSQVDASGLPLRGVIHTAGVLEDGLLMQQTAAQFRRVMAPKILGALHLDALTRRAPLDFFVLYASAAGLLGSPGQSNYAAANTFLDALAHHRRARGLPALSVDWGAFSEVGLAAAQDNRGTRLAARGMRSFTPEEGLEALQRLLDAERSQAGVVPLDVRQWVEFYPAAASSPMLSRLLAETSSRTSRTAQGVPLTERLARAAPAERPVVLQAFVREEAARVLRIPEARFDTSAPLTSLGMDSLMGLELRNRLEAGLGFRMPATLLWTYPTVVALSDHLTSQLAPLLDPGATPVAHEEPQEDDPTPLDDLDEEGLLALLDESLARAKGYAERGAKDGRRRVE
ncbi:type I polyketide synthase [Chondromyces crocatus]|uniref:Polyketide synthase n=1 Tax=Chondromyces crocatus TaxID=52 RepID=Q0VZ73_CHOCO|nr:type I polyketide synthase [Chondromyces crocatus]AKT40598.1 polyketide synthase [Chondromyces crocatus]CAJ46689.1 polyketide synthase [Chondromyces crocatus]